MKRNIIRVLVATALAGASALAGGCTVHGRAYTTGYDSRASGELVMVSPGVYAVADYDRPVFYNNDSYWTYQDGTWYRSGYYTGGWVRAQSVPRAVLSIESPRAYVRWHSEGRTRIRARDHRPHRPHYDY